MAFCPLREFELLLISQGTAKGLLSKKKYGILLQLTEEEDKPKRYWEINLGYPISKIDWQRISKKGHKISLNVYFCENCYRLKPHWYFTLQKMSKMYPAGSNVSWRCGKKGLFLSNMVALCKFTTFFTHYLLYNIKNNEI